MDNEKKDIIKRKRLKETVTKFKKGSDIKKGVTKFSTLQSRTEPATPSPKKVKKKIEKRKEE